MTIPVYRLIEVVLYSLLNFLPFVLLALYPFRKQLRFSPKVTGFLVALICLIQIILGLFAAFSSVSAEVVTLLSTGIYALCYFFLVKARLGKVLFTLLVLSNIANLVVIISKCLEGLIFGAIALESYRWSLCLCMLLVHLLVTLPLFFYARSKYTAAMEIQSFSWVYLWIIPTTFYLIWYYHLYLTAQDSLQVALNVGSTVFLLLINLGAAVVYHTTVLLLIERDKAQNLSHLNHQLSIHKLQHENLQHRINEARQAKHDVRHHAHLIQEYLRAGKLQELEAYLDRYTASLPSTQSLIHCQHYATNALLGYFAQQAQDNGIEMDIFVQLPEIIHLPETTLSVVLGNLLENAIDACREITDGTRKITVRGKAEAGSVFFEVTNTFRGDLRRHKTGKLLSTKAFGHGVGLESVAQLANASGGMLELEDRDGIFRASVLIMENAKAE